MSKKYIKILISISVITIIGVFCFVNFSKKEISEPIKSQSVNGGVVKSVEEKIEIKNETDGQTVINIGLSVLDKTYNTRIEEGASVYNAMIKIKSENNFDFKYKEYPSLGIFINEINGIKEKPGKYWIYYINNKEASVGVSNYILKDGDSILWKQE